MTRPAPTRPGAVRDPAAPSAVRIAAARPGDEVRAGLGTPPEGLAADEAARRAAESGPNALGTHRARPWAVLGRQIKSPVLLLLLATTIIAASVGDVGDALVIGAILLLSTGLGFVNEFRAERTADALHDRLRHSAVVVRDGARVGVDVTAVVPGDLVVLAVGAVVPADLRLLECEGLECDESILTGEAAAAAKDPEAVRPGAGVGDLSCCALMGTVVHAGRALGVAVATGTDTEFGRIAAGLARQLPQTEFQRGLGRFSVFLLVVAVVLTTTIFAVAVALGRPLLESLLFSLAIAVGITPQLLPAVVSTSLAAGARSLARRRVLVRRMVCIEDLGDLDLLVTDKTGTLTTGRILFEEAAPLDGGSEDDLLVLGALATEGGAEDPSRAGLNALDAALWERVDGAPALRAAVAARRRLAAVPFDHERRMSSALVADGPGRLIVVKGAPESVLARCTAVPPGARARLDDHYRAGRRVIAVATRAAEGLDHVSAADEAGLALRGLLVFADDVKPGAGASLAHLAGLGVAVKVATGDGAVVAERVCAELGMPAGGTLTGDDVDRLDDAGLAHAAEEATVFARVSPEQKARIVRALRRPGRAVGFLGDGVNDALALHGADIGISVDSAVDVARDAADVLLLDKDLDVLATGVTEGRRIFANTLKYVMMGTSSNFGNMFSASIASVILPFLPLLPGQILLNNLLYDASQLAIPSDRVDPERLRTPSHWDIGAIRRFMLLFGPISSVFDLATFALMLWVFHARPEEFRSGWFIESIATQSLIVFAIRTRQVPFFRSRPSPALTVSVLAVVLVGAWLPFSPFNGLLGFTALPAPFFLALVATTLAYLVLVEAAKVWYFARLATPPRAAPARERGHATHLARRAARFRPRTGT